MNLINYIKNNGIKRFFKVLYEYKIDLFYEKIIYIFTKKMKLKDYIVIESHNDFDCNGGAFYNYLIKNNYNNKYKIIWLLRKKIDKSSLPKNVDFVYLNKPSIKKAFYMCISKYFTYDCDVRDKIRKDQKVVYCSHGAGGLKKAKGNIIIPVSVDYLLCLSPYYISIQSEQWSLNKNDPRFVYIGYPSQDIFFHKSPNEFLKISKNKYNKVFLWMPTFRKGNSYNRNDSLKEQKLGIPLFENKEQLCELNNYLKKDNNYLILKIHPKQDLSSFDLRDLSNISVLTGARVKELKIDNYNLIKCADALISDYSGAAYDFLQLDRPIGYILDDMNEYKLGFVVDDIHKLIAGHEIYDIKELYSFIDDVTNNKDAFITKRKKLRNYIYNHHDGNASLRLVQLLGLTNKKAK